MSNVASMATFGDIQSGGLGNPTYPQRAASVSLVVGATGAGVVSAANATNAQAETSITMTITAPAKANGKASAAEKGMDLTMFVPF